MFKPREHGLLISGTVQKVTQSTLDNNADTMPCVFVHGNVFVAQGKAVDNMENKDTQLWNKMYCTVSVY